MAILMENNNTHLIQDFPGLTNDCQHNFHGYTLNMTSYMSLNELIAIIRTEV